MRRWIALSAVLCLTGFAGAAAAQERDAPVAQVNWLEGLRPLEAADLGKLRAGRLPVVIPPPQPSMSPVRLWDEISRPPRTPAISGQGSITSTSRGVR